MNKKKIKIAIIEFDNESLNHSESERLSGAKRRWKRVKLAPNDRC